MAKKTVVLEEYQMDTIYECIRDTLELDNLYNYESDFDIAVITSRIEAMHALGYKKEARRFVKEFKDIIRETAWNREKGYTKYLLSELSSCLKNETEKK